MIKRPFNTLFMLTSIDGKISSGETDNLDCDKDWKEIKGVKEGLEQYYEIEQTTDLWSFNTGRVLSKVGFNERKDTPKKSPVSFVVIDNQQHLNENGLKYLSAWLDKLVIVTENKNYNSYGIKNLDVIYYDKIDFENLFEELYDTYKMPRITIQSGGTMNSILLRKGLIDNIRIIVAPIAVGGEKTSSLFDGYSLKDTSELGMLKGLKLINCKQLESSYLDLTYEVIN